MLIIVIAAIGIVVGVVAHLVLGERAGYSWFGEIVLAFCGAAVFGLIVGILAGARDLSANFGEAISSPAAIQIIIAAFVGAILVDGLAIVLTFRAIGRGAGQTAG
jgi:uncharacterized membrane protein YeaQ/YmgE (transglycosylase-associated protein family)